MSTHFYIIIRRYLVTEGGQITLQALVFALETLHGRQVIADVVRVQRGVLLLNPVLGLISISVL